MQQRNVDEFKDRKADMMSLLPCQVTLPQLNKIRCIAAGLLLLGAHTSVIAQSTTDAVISAEPVSFTSEAFADNPQQRNGQQSVGSLSLSVEAIFAKIDDSNVLVGARNAPQSVSGGFKSVDLGAIEGTHVGGTALEPGLVGQQVSDSIHTGMKYRLNYRGQQNSGLEVNGFWFGDTGRSWQRGLGGFDAGADPTTVRVTAALPLSDGAGGYAVPYDQYFRVALNTSMYGLGADYTPYGGYMGTILVQPTVGVRYIDIDETFNFAGAHSGLSYTQQANGLPVESSLTPPVAAVPPYQSSLAVASDSWFFGPCFGVNLATTGKRFRLSSNSRVGGLFADTQQTLIGQGIGNGLAPGFDQTLTVTSNRSRSYGTGFFEQNIYADIELMGLLKRYGTFSGKNSLALRVGWSLLAIESLSRPAESIAWNGSPQQPRLKKSSNDFMLQTWNIGLLFQY